MTGTYLTGMADWLRAAGLDVVEQSGWQTRARSSGGYSGNRPWCVMWHHTASNASSDGQADVNYILNSQDAPLSNIYINRAGKVWVIAAGATNTNGKGNSLQFSKGCVPTDSMNTHAVGIEVANNGVGESWPQAQIDAFFAVSNCINAHLGNQPDDVATHAHYAPSRKIDPATASAVQGPWQPRSINANGTWNVDDVKAECLRRAQVKPPPPRGNDLMFTVCTIIGHPEALGGNMDGNGIIAQITWLNPNRYAAVVGAGAPVIELSLGDLINCDLIGPCPPSMQPGNFANAVT